MEQEFIMGKFASAIGTIGGGLIGGPAGAAIGGALGGMIGGGPDVSGAYGGASAQQQQAYQNAQFRPVGITTGFGSSNFEIDPATNQLKSAGYTLNPQLQDIRNRVLGQASAYRPEDIYGLTQPLVGGAQGMFGLGQQLLPTSTTREASPEAQALAQRYQQAAMGLAPTSYDTSASPEAMAYANQLRGVAGQVMPTSYDTTAAAQQYFQQQQGLLAPQREQQLSSVRNRLFQTGRQGLATGGTAAGNMAQTNPELAAYYNSLAQQDAQLAAGAQDRARAQLQQDIGLGTALGGQALTTQQQAEATSRQNMLQNLGLSLGFGTTGLGTATGAEDLARQRFAQDLGLGTGLFSSGAGTIAQIPALTSAAYSPLQTQLGLGTTVEAMGQQALGLGSELGGRASSAAAQAGQLANSSALTGLAGQVAQQGIDATRQTTLQNQLGGLFSNPQAQSQMQGIGGQVSNWFNNLISPTPYSGRGTIYSNTAGGYTGFDY